jgi:hypothetical protein
MFKKEKEEENEIQQIEDFKKVNNFKIVKELRSSCEAHGFEFNNNPLDILFMSKKSSVISNLDIKNNCNTTEFQMNMEVLKLKFYDENKFFLNLEGKKLLLYDIKNKKDIVSFNSKGFLVSSFNIKNKNEICIGCDNGHINLLDIRKTSEFIQSVKISAEKIQNIEFTLNNDIIIAAGKFIHNFRGFINNKKRSQDVFI